MSGAVWEWRRGAVGFQLGSVSALGAGLVALLSVAAVGRLVSVGTIIALWNYALLPVGVLALFLAARHHRSDTLGVFLAGISLAFSFWLIVGVLRGPLADVLSAQAFALFRDAMFGGFYVVFLWAVEGASGGSRRSRAEKTVALFGSVALVAGSVVYLRVLPELFGAGGDPMPYLVLYAGLDLYLAGRLMVLVQRSRAAHQRLVYGLLAGSLFMFALAELLDFGFATGAIPQTLSPSLTVFWAIPFVPLLLAAHVRPVGSVPEQRPLAQPGNAIAGDLFSSSWSPLIGYGFALPAAHLFLYSTGRGSDAVEQVRGWLILVWLAILALLIFAQRAAIARRVATNERQLRDSFERIRRLSGAREAAVERERRRLSEELDDGLSDQLVLLRDELAALDASKLVSEPELNGRLEAAAALTREALDAAHGISTGLRPRVLDELGLAPALRELVADTAARSQLDIRFADSHEQLALDSERETVMYRIVQESLTNCVKHSQASRVEVELAHDRDGIALKIRDDGVGLDADGGDHESGLGLLSIRERVRSAGGRLTFGSGIGGRGLSIRVLLPWRVREGWP